MSDPKMSVGDTFLSDGRIWEVTDEPFLNDSVEGEQWWYPSRVVSMRNIKESDVDDLERISR